MTALIPEIGFFLQTDGEGFENRIAAFTALGAVVAESGKSGLGKNDYHGDIYDDHYCLE